MMCNIRGLQDGTIKKLKVQEANDMVIKILQAIVLNDDLDTTGEETDYGSVANKTDQDSDHETDGDDGNNVTIIEVMSLPI